jgi:hypothetical protein
MKSIRVGTFAAALLVPLPALAHPDIQEPHGLMSYAVATLLAVAILGAIWATARNRR